MRQALPTREVSNEEFEAAVAQWTPKLVRFAQNYFPYKDWEDKMQEGGLVLFQCLRKFDATRGATFHTMFHRALHNRALELGSGRYSRVLKENELYGRENPNSVVYLGEISDNEASDGGSNYFTKEKIALGSPADTNLIFEAVSWGFEGLEIAVMVGRAHELSLEETAEFYQIDITVLEGAVCAAEIKINQLRGG